jgi:hypothetical protein
VALAAGCVGAGSGVPVSAIRVATGMVIVGSSVGMGTRVTIGLVGTTMFGGVGVCCVEHAVIRTRAASINHRFIKDRLSTPPHLR